MHSTSLDIWSVGCTFSETTTGKALFPGDSDIGTLLLQLQLLGMPDESTWPGVTSLKNFTPELPRFKAKNMAEALPSLKENQHALDLFSQMLKFDPSARISAQQALQHPYFLHTTKEWASDTMTACMAAQPVQRPCMDFDMPAREEPHMMADYIVDVDKHHRSREARKPDLVPVFLFKFMMREF